jgi:hypothetical protein
MTSSRATTNVFDSDFLNWLSRRDAGGPSWPEAEYGGPWTVREQESGFAVVREGAEREEPYAVLEERETALLLAAILPTIGREQRYQLGTSAAGGTDVRTLAGGTLRKVGWVHRTDPELMEGLNVVEWLLRSPGSLAMVLEAASYHTLADAGRILRRRLHAGEGEPA